MYHKNKVNLDKNVFRVFFFYTYMILHDVVWGFVDSVYSLIIWAEHQMPIAYGVKKDAKALTEKQLRRQSRWGARANSVVCIYWVLRERRLAATAVGSGDFSSQARAIQSRLTVHPPSSLRTDQHAHCATSSACQQEWVRGYSVIYGCHDDFEKPSFYLQFPLTSTSSLCRNPVAVSTRRVMLTAARGHFVTQMKSEKKECAAGDYKCVLLQYREVLL